MILVLIVIYRSRQEAGDMLSQLVLGLSLWMPSRAYAGLSPFHAASTVAHQSEVPAGGFAHAPIAVTWSPGTQTMTDRMEEGAQADQKTESLHEIFRGAQPKIIDKQSEQLTGEEIAQRAGQLVYSVEKAKKREYTMRSRKLQSGEKAQPATAPTGADQSKTTTLVAPTIDTMKTYTAEELIRIEKKAKELTEGYDYTYMGHGTFLQNAKTRWDIHGTFGRIRVYDKDDHTLLYETDCCYCGGQSRGKHDHTTGEALIEAAMTICGVATCGTAYVAYKILRETY